MVCCLYASQGRKKVINKLEILGIQSYLPLHQVVRDWSDRKKKLIVPLFPNYIFIYVSDKKRHETFSVKEIVRYVSFEGKPATVHNTTIDSLKRILEERVEIEVENCIGVGTPVRINRGPFVGVEGVVVNRHGNTRLIIQITALQRCVAVNIAENDVAALCS